MERQRLSGELEAARVIQQLPLGIVEGADYGSRTVEVGAVRVTFVSDGVIEARNAGGELLGFDRMPALSLKTAREIAQAAEDWGQDDDITVVTVRRAA